AGDTRACVMVDFDNKIIEMIRPAQPVAGLPDRRSDRPVIAAVGRVLAPGIGGGDAPDRKRSRWPGMAIGAPPQPYRPKTAERRTSVALPLVRQNAAAPERHRPGEGTGAEPAPRAAARRGADVNGTQGLRHPWPLLPTLHFAK